MNMKKKYQDMTTKELREATREFDVESVDPPGRPLNTREKALWAKAQKKAPRGAPHQRQRFPDDQFEHGARSAQENGYRAGEDEKIAGGSDCRRAKKLPATPAADSVEGNLTPRDSSSQTPEPQSPDASPSHSDRSPVPRSASSAPPRSSGR